MNPDGGREPGSEPGAGPGAGSTAVSVAEPDPRPDAEPEPARIAGSHARPGPAPGRIRMLAARLTAALSGRDPVTAGDPVPSGTDAGAGQVEAEPPGHVPGLLRDAASWSWRLLLIGLVAYYGFRAAIALRLLVVPLLAAILLSALLQPLTARLRRAGMPALAATWCTLLAAIALLAGIGMLVANRVQADYPRLVTEVQQTAHRVQRYLAGPPLRLSQHKIQHFADQILRYLSQHKSLVASTVLAGGQLFIELLTGLILTIFITFFLLKDGDRIWQWLVSGLRPAGRARANRAGAAAWQVLVSYVRGATLVAAIHAVAIGIALWLLGVPLLVPLVILVFLAAYVPLVGILVVGALAIGITAATKGWIAALVLLIVFLAENQLESHLLQPLVIGRVVRLHPLAIIVVLAIGGILAGVAGAIVAVPIAAVITYTWPYLRRGAA